MNTDASIFPNGAQITLHRRYPKNFKVDIVENGFIVSIGCKELVFDSLPMLLNAIELYTEAPEEAEKKYCNSEDNPAERPHGMSLSYASKKVKDLKSKHETAVKLWS